MLDMILKNGVVVTQNDKREILKTNIGIKNGRIEKIGDDFTKAKIIIDASSYVITPAYLNGHIHFGEYYLRGYKEKLTTEDYIILGEKFYKLFINEYERIRSSSIDNVMCESIKNGTLTVMGVRGWPNVQKFGVNAFLGYPVMNSEKLDSYTDDLENRFNMLNKEENVEYFIGLHSLKWLSDKGLNKVMKFLALYNNTKLSLHVCETKDEVMYITQKYKMSPIKALSKFGLLNENTLLVHCNYLSNDDIDIIKQSNASVAVCHSSNLKLGNFPCDIRRLLDAEINVLIATDGPATSDSLSLLEALRVSALVSNVETQRLYDMITINPAKYMKINTGSIQVGNLADVLFYDRNELGITYPNAILQNLVYIPSNKPCFVMKSGNFIIKNYEFVDDIKKILKEKNEIIKLIEMKAREKNFNFFS